MSSTIKQGRSPIYEASLKIAIAREYLTGNLGYGKLAMKHGLPIRTVIHFVRWYNKNYPPSTSMCSIEKPVEVADNGELEEKLKAANLKITALEIMIEKANKELDIDIVKKSGTKQPLR
jgi:transposase